MSTSQHTSQIVHDALGHYVGIGMEDPETPHQFPPQLPNPPTTPTPLNAHTFIHIPHSPTHPPAHFNSHPLRSIPRPLKRPQSRNIPIPPNVLLLCPAHTLPNL